MELSLRYMYTKALCIDESATIADEHVAPLKIQWVGIASTRFASHAAFSTSSPRFRSALTGARPKGMFGCVVPKSIASNAGASRASSYPTIATSTSCCNYLVKRNGALSHAGMTA